MTSYRAGVTASTAAAAGAMSGARQTKLPAGHPAYEVLAAAIERRVANGTWAQIDPDWRPREVSDAHRP